MRDRCPRKTALLSQAAPGAAQTPLPRRVTQHTNEISAQRDLLSHKSSPSENSMKSQGPTVSHMRDPPARAGDAVQTQRRREGVWHQEPRGPLVMDIIRAGLHKPNHAPGKRGNPDPADVHSSNPVTYCVYLGPKSSTLTSCPRAESWIPDPVDLSHPGRTGLSKPRIGLCSALEKAHPFQKITSCFSGLNFPAFLQATICENNV